jgi:pimeloyl-ACP methyl ester carboxylesterase
MDCQNRPHLRHPCEENNFVKPGHLATIALAAVGLTGCGAHTVAATKGGDAAAYQAHCAALVGSRLGIGTIEKTEHVAQDVDLISPERRAMLKAILPMDLPPMPSPRGLCRVWAGLRPVPGSLIKVQVWLPDAWNRKMLALGGGGFNGGMFSATVNMFPGAQRGYATMVTDVGHEMSDSAKFAHDNREQFIDYGHRANHVTASFTKDLIASYYGKPARLAYFQGGSNGGREALMEARRYPDDYDGIIAGQPATSFTKVMASFMWNRLAIRGNPGASGLVDKLPILEAAVLKKCDAIDGLSDGLIEDPTACTFDPVDLRCKSGDAAHCLTPDEVTVVQKIYGGPRLGDGRQLFPGLAFGAEARKDNWPQWLFGDKPLQAGMGEEFARWMVHGDPKWQVSQFDLYRDYQLASERAAAILDSDDPDISAFIERGGKLILVQGWTDAAIPPGSTLNYYEAMQKKLGAVADRQVRLFMVPGMGHGPGGPVPDEMPLLDELDQWVEGAPAPDTVIASQYDPPRFFGTTIGDHKVVRTRPICAWPKHARYDGKGPVDDQASFRCQ